MTDMAVYSADKQALEAGWKALTDIPIDENENLDAHFECMGRKFPKGTPRWEVWSFFDTMGFFVANRMNGINPFFRSGVDPAGFNEKTADAIIIQPTSRTFIWLYARGLDALAVTTRGETVKVDFVNYDKCLSTLKSMVDKKIQVKFTPWLLDEVNLLQTPEGND
jgi:hypothetical protein